MEHTDDNLKTNPNLVPVRDNSMRAFCILLLLMPVVFIVGMLAGIGTNNNGGIVVRPTTAEEKIADGLRLYDYENRDKQYIKRAREILVPPPTGH